MEIKISEEKLEKIIDVVFDSLGVDKHDSFQSRSINTYYIEFLTPGTRQSVISRYYPDLNLAVVNDEKFYDLVSSDRFKTRNYGDIRNIKYRSDEEFNKK